MKRLLIALSLLACHQAQAQFPLAEDTQRVVRICGVVSDADGLTPVTTLDLTTANFAEALRENTATLDISAATFSAITGADGCYSLTLSTTATATVGELVVWIADTDLILPIERHFIVLEEAVYNACCLAGATDTWTAAARTLTAIDEDSTTLDLNATTVGGVSVFDEDTTTIDINGTTIGTVTTLTGHTAQTGDAFARLGAPAGASVSADIAAIEGQTDDIGAAGAGLTAADDAVITLLGTPAGADVSTDIAAIEGQTDDIGAAGAGLTAIPDLDTLLTIEQVGSIQACDSGSTTTCVDAARTQADADYWRGAAFIVLSGTSAGQVRCVTDFNAGTDTITFSPALTQAITTNNYILGRDAVCVGVAD